MQHKANPTLIGLFVLIGIAIGISALLLLGAPGAGGKPYNMVVYFEGGVSGLNVGAPVNLRGVQIGSVKSIQINFEEKDMTLEIPVVISIDQNLIGLRGESIEKSDEKLVNRLIEHGLRATLSLQSLLTGRLQIDLDFHPDTKARLVGSNHGLLELPTIQSSLDKLTQTLTDLPIEKIATKALKILDAAERLITAPELMQTVQNLGKAGDDAAALINSLREEISPLLGQWRTVGVNADDLINNLDNQVKPVAGSLQRSIEKSHQTLVELDKVFSQAEKTLATLGASFDNESPLYHELQSAMGEIGAAARAVRIMAEYLERHPEALIQGKTER